MNAFQDASSTVAVDGVDFRWDNLLDDSSHHWTQCHMPDREYVGRRNLGLVNQLESQKSFHGRTEFWTHEMVSTYSLKTGMNVSNPGHTEPSLVDKMCVKKGDDGEIFDQVKQIHFAIRAVSCIPDPDAASFLETAYALPWSMIKSASSIGSMFRLTEKTNQPVKFHRVPGSTSEVVAEMTSDWHQSVTELWLPLNETQFTSKRLPSKVAVQVVAYVDLDNNDKDIYRVEGIDDNQSKLHFSALDVLPFPLTLPPLSEPPEEGWQLIDPDAESGAEA